MIPTVSATGPGHTERIAVFASGSGSNAERIIRHFAQHPTVQVTLLVCNKPEAGVRAKAAAAGIPELLIERGRFLSGDAYLPELKAAGISFLVLAGFLWKVPAALIEAYPRRIVNIHPALLPRFGGKGMWGAHVHQAVLEAGETESGITIHYVDEHYDHGDHIFQARCPVLPGDSPDTLAARVLALEHRHFAEVVERVVLGSEGVSG
ncbi:phosphoribosylglycinamide formyltransferase [Flaviaesturariibacter amylovorans]|uniref:Phosphoribosylglycinamide formyltransferase n=1 Tax=Flaviaesturariibacter amylovorans TaxID=1084520 RepID=A0ABP8HQU2_9BACT